MANVLMPVFGGQYKLLRDMSDGTYAEVVAVELLNGATDAQADAMIALLTIIANEAQSSTPAPVTLPNVSEYETVAASATAQVIGGSGAAGDYISHLIIIPASVSPGAVALLDNATSISVFAGGTNSVPSLAPIIVALGMTSVSGAWKITTGANVSVIAVGQFT